jgi:hypothetical protein
MTNRETPDDASVDRQTGPARKGADTKSSQAALLRTPAGPISEEKLSHVPPGKRVRRTPQGNNVIEDADAANFTGGPGSSPAENEDG